MKNINNYEHTVRYYETDQMKIVHHSNYIRWFEDARIDWMNKIGVPYDYMEECGILIPVLSVSVNYKKMIRFGQTIVIKLIVKKFNSVKVMFEYEIYDKETGDLCTTGDSTHCFLDKSMKPVMLKKVSPDIYEKISVCVDFF